MINEEQMTNEEAIKFLKGYLDEMAYTEKCRTAHKMAIQALEQTNWIPVSERLPEDSDDYLVWIKPDGEKPYVSIEDIDCDGMVKKWNTIYAHANEIVAWMPLPSSYQGESEE